MGRNMVLLGVSIGLLAMSAAIQIEAMASRKPAPSTIRVAKNAVMLGGKPGRLMYKAVGDLDRDGKKETVFSVMLGCTALYTVIARPTNSECRIIAIEQSGYGFSRADVADVNSDGRQDMIVRTASGDGHDICFVYDLIRGKLVEISPEDSGPFGLTRFADIDHDGKLEVLSITDPTFAFLGDFWLTIWKWNGTRYIDVSDRFPAQYDRVISGIRQMIYRLHYTNYYGHPDSPNDNPVFGDLYYYLGRAYELRQQPGKARIQYAIAYRLYPDADWIVDAFRRTWKSGALRK